MNREELKSFLLARLADSVLSTEKESLVRIYMEDAFDHSKASWSESDVKQAEADIDRIIGGYPIQYIVGKAYFYNRFFTVTEAVLIPRPETEELVALCVASMKEEYTLLDIGTGSGCIVASVASKFQSSTCIGIDVSQEACQLALENAQNLDNVMIKNIDFLDESAWDALGKIDFLVSNPPYICLLYTSPSPRD